MENQCLTKEQINSLGWELIQLYPNGVCVFMKGTKEEGYELLYSFNTRLLSFAKLSYFGLDDVYKRNNLFFEALEVEDIDTLKYLMKLLKIK